MVNNNNNSSSMMQAVKTTRRQHRRRPSTFGSVPTSYINMLTVLWILIGIGLLTDIINGNSNTNSNTRGKNVDVFVSATEAAASSSSTSSTETSAETAERHEQPPACTNNNNKSDEDGEQTCTNPTLVADSADSSITGSSQSSSDTSVQRRLINWVVTNGGYWFDDGQEFQMYNSMYGIYATTFIPKGTLLLKVPETCIIQDWDYQRDGGYGPMDAIFCGTTSKVLSEIKKGDESHYAPYLNYIRTQPRGKLPSDWSDAAKEILEDVVLGHNSTHMERPFPPLYPTSYVDEYIERCVDGNVNVRDDHLEILVAMEVLLRSDDQYLVPLYDLYNHVNGPDVNVVIRPIFSDDDDDDDDDDDVLVGQEVYAGRDIQAGEELRYSYSQTHHVSRYSQMYYSTPDFLRDYGFVESYPQRWVFLDNEVGFDVVVSKDDGSLEVQWLDWMELSFTSKEKKFFRRHLKRLKDSAGPSLKSIQDDVLSASNEDNEAKSLPTPHEISTMIQYVDAAIVACQLFLEAVNRYEMDYVDLNELEKGVRTPNSHETFPTYNDQFYPLAVRDPGWITLDGERSMYQEISFLGHNENVCFILENEPQTCSYFSAHYHDIAAHFPTRYLDKIERVAILGGGDSKMLHEVLKYPTVTKVVHMELDQKVTRKSFKFFGSEPHFNDDRVEWYFGDCAKTLRVLPSEYFGTFDLVFVDLSESGPLSFAVSENITVWESIVQLLSPDGILVKNEIYNDELNKVFDHTLMLYYENVPMIESWVLTFGTNRKDLLKPSASTMTKWSEYGIKTIISSFEASAKDIHDHFSLAHDYSYNNAYNEGRCKEPAAATVGSQSTAGVLLVIDVEDVTAIELLGDWSGMESALTSTLAGQGFTKRSSVSQTHDGGRVFGAVIFSEGLLLVRSWPDEKYCAVDVQLWSSLDRIGEIKQSIVTLFKAETVSSYRVVSSGILIPEMPASKLGPPGLNHRDCTKAVNDDTTDSSKIENRIVNAAVTVGLGMAQEPEGLIIVLCGAQKSPCESFRIASIWNAEHSGKGSPKQVALWTCPPIVSITSLDDANDEQIKDLNACGGLISHQLKEAVARHGKVATMILDESAPYAMGLIADRFWRSLTNQQHLLEDRFTFLAPIVDRSELWRRNFLDNLRAEMIDYGHLFRAEVEIHHDGETMDLDFLSGKDTRFVGRLVGIVEKMNEKIDSVAHIRKIEGGVEELELDQQKEWVSHYAYDRPGEKRFSHQRHLGEQHLLQFTAADDDVGEITSDIIHDMIDKVFNFDYPIPFQGQEERIGNGLVVVRLTSYGTFSLVWDGADRVDVDLFVYDRSSKDGRFFMDRAAGPFVKQFRLRHLSADEMPRGVGRVVNLKKDMNETVDEIRARATKEVEAEKRRIIEHFMERRKNPDARRSVRLEEEEDNDGHDDDDDEEE